LRKMKGMQFRELERWRPDIPKLSQRFGNLTKYCKMTPMLMMPVSLRPGSRVYIWIALAI